MRALVFSGPSSLVVEERPVPVPAAGERRLRVRAVGICGSDLHGYTGENGRRQFGMIMGHEIAAIDEATDRLVTVHPVLFCGDCTNCLAGRTEACAKRRVIGVTPELQGGFADWICVPEQNIVPMDGATAEYAALVEPMAVGLHAVRIGSIQPGDRVTVIGGGTIGIVCALAASDLGAEAVIVEPSPHRRAVAAAAGLTAVEPGSGSQLPVGARSADVAIDAVGTTATLDAALAATRELATVVLVGMGRPRIEFDLLALVVSQRRILGTFCYSERDFLDAAAWVRTGSPPLDHLIERRPRFDGVADVFHRLALGQDDAVKALLIVD